MPSVSRPSPARSTADANVEWLAHVAARLPARRWRTRFAPAPTGYLHLGHLVNALYVWGMARQFGGDVLLRLEDHDRSRCRSEYESALLDDLDWLGFEADIANSSTYRSQPTSHPVRQSDNPHRYRDALAAIEAKGMVYPCLCTRRDIEALVPHPAGEAPRYPGTCRDRQVDPRSTNARRVRMAPAVVSFDDLRLGPMAHDPDRQCGDVMVRDRLGHWTYQFAVAVDDVAQHIDVIIRGEDLLASTARQFRLTHLLGRDVPPITLHHPLLVHPHGGKLSKANRDTALQAYRAAGVRPEVLLGEAAFLAGLAASSASISAHDVASLFRVVR
ncbi:MAG: tRNA glutamyl-Q(34) synthetase GluQRS [Gemmatimonadaceae bacterium]|nr:tRNA glutamyl-Q(34) synthetase GluQRS [Gemmatimonadaceae bacterium]